MFLNTWTVLTVCGVLCGSGDLPLVSQPDPRLFSLVSGVFQVIQLWRTTGRPLVSFPVTTEPVHFKKKPNQSEISDQSSLSPNAKLVWDQCKQIQTDLQTSLKLDSTQFETSLKQSDPTSHQFESHSKPSFQSVYTRFFVWFPGTGSGSGVEGSFFLSSWFCLFPAGPVTGQYNPSGQGPEGSYHLTPVRPVWMLKAWACLPPLVYL